MIETPGEEAARAALKASMAVNNAQQALTEESRVLLAGLLRNEMRVAVAEGLEAVVTNRAVWAKVFTVLQEQASERTGRFVLGGVKALLKKAFWIALFATAAYAVGGLTLLKTVWAAITKV